MRRLSAGGVPLLLMCYFLSAALCPFCCLPGRAEAAQQPSRQSWSSNQQLQHSRKLTGEGAERLEVSLLNMFGLKKRPRPRREAINVPDFLIELYRHQTGLDVDTTNLDLRGKLTQSANTVRTFAHQEDEDSERDGDSEGQQQVRLRFDLSSVPMEEVLKAAELRLYRGGSAPASGTRTAEGRRDQAQSSGEGRRSQEADKCRRHSQQSGEGGAPAPVTTTATSADDGCQVRQVQREKAGKRRRKDNHRQQVLIHEIVRPVNPSRRGHEEPILRLLDTRIVDTSQQGWETFDVLPALLRWREEPHRNYGLLIQVRPLTAGNATGDHFHLRRPARRRRRRSSGNSSNSSDGSESDPQDAAQVTDSEHLWASHQPLLVTYTDDGKARHRSKRAAEKKHKRKGRRDNCRRHSLYVDFSDVGWNDWIVAPPGYQAFYCLGDCPFALPDHLNTTNHAIVQTLVHSVNPGAVPRACCVPTELSSISMLYIDEYDKVVLKNYHDMVVEACGCR